MPKMCALGYSLHSRATCKIKLSRTRAFNRISNLSVEFSKELPMASALARIDPPLLAKTDPPPARVTMDGHARSPEETLPDLPAVVLSGRASRPTSTRLR